MAVDLPPMSLEETQRYFDRPAYVQSADVQTDAAMTEAMKAKRNEAQKAHSKAMLDAALSTGVKAGLAWQLNNIQAAISQHERDFDTIYDFAQLMIRDRVVPPVITEARDLYNQDGDYALRLSGAYYKIERQARFSSVPPSWREYLTFSKPAVDRSLLLSGLIPRSDEEREIWKLAVRDGWNQGVDQANLMLQYGLDRLNRDFVGMIRFHRFVNEGKITLPAIAVADIPVSKTGQVMAVDETLLRITTLPGFNGKMETWKGWVTPSLPTANPVPAHKEKSTASTHVSESN